MAAAARITPPQADEADTIAEAYLVAAGGDAVRALHQAVADALADLREVERRTQARERLISYGYVRCGLGIQPVSR